MNTFQFKTNIQCNGCIAKITPALNQATGIEKWAVDILNPKKILTIETQTLNENELIKIIKDAGYVASKLD